MVPYWIPKAEKSEWEWVRFLPKWVRKFNWSHLQVCLGVERNWCYFRLMSGRKWITRQGFLDSFSSASRKWTRKTSSYRGGIRRGTRDRREFYFRSRYFRFRPRYNPRSFRVNFHAYNYLRTTGTRLRSQNHIPVDLGWETTSGRSLSVSDRPKMAPGADMEVGQL